MEPAPGKRTGTLFLPHILVACAVLAVAAYLGQGHMGIEERFSSALGLPGEEEAGEGAGSPGSIVEGVWSCMVSSPRCLPGLQDSCMPGTGYKIPADKTASWDGLWDWA